MTHGTMHGIRGTSGNLAVHGGNDAGAGGADGARADSATFGGRGAVGAFLRDAREAAALSQQALATKCGTMRETIASWENGTARPTRERFLAACAALGVDGSAMAYGLPPSRASSSFASAREDRAKVATALREARRNAGAPPTALRAHGITERRIRSIESGQVWPTEAEVRAMRECYRKRDLLPDYRRHTPTSETASGKRVPLSPEERAAAVAGGEFIRRHRLAAKLSPYVASRRIGVVATTLKHWERGLDRPRSENLARCAEVLGFDLESYRNATDEPSDDDMARAARMAAAPTFPVRRGSIWARGAGRRVVVECDAVEGDRIRYRPLPDGDMLITSWETFTARYTEVGV